MMTIIEMIGTDLTWKHGAGGGIDFTWSEHPRYPVCRLGHWLLDARIGQFIESSNLYMIALSVLHTRLLFSSCVAMFIG
jgi:hypothetical protein